jgi:hypothetical protein
MAQDWKLDASVTQPLSDEDAALEARVRTKLELGERLTAEEAEFFARMPADKGLRPIGDHP